jgi:hypothetical protein
MQTFGLIRAIVWCCVFALCACVTGPEVRVDKDPNANLSSYKTFAFFDKVSTDNAQYSSLVSTRLKQGTRAQLERLGFTYAENEPDLRVNFFLKVVDKQRLRSTPSGYYSYRAGYYGTWGNYPYMDTVDYRDGTLSIDLVDAKRSQLIWQGVAEGEVSDESMKNPGPALDKIVTRIFSNFPNTPQ